MEPTYVETKLALQGITKLFTVSGDDIYQRVVNQEAEHLPMVAPMCYLKLVDEATRGI